MELLFERVAGLDVHRDQVTGCVRAPRASGRGRSSTIQEHTTTTAGLRRLHGWLLEHRVTHVAMEATGVYWRPVYAMLEHDFEVLLVNAAHMHNVPGRKTDIADATWIAQLLEHGLLRGSFVPPPDIRRLRNLTRYRKSLVGERVRVLQRMDKALQDAGIKLTSVASTLATLSGRDMLAALAGGERDPEALANLARGRMRSKIPMLQEALEGRFDDHHAVVTRAGLDHLEFLDAAIAKVSADIAALCEPHAWALELLETIPGVSRRSAEVLIAEIGVGMSVFPTAGHLASWAGMCPGNHKSARRSGPGTTRPGSPWLNDMLIEAAQAAGRTKNSYLAARHARLRARRGKQRAAVATGHAILVAAWHILTRREPFNELGGDYYDRRHNPRAEAERLARRLRALGHDVTLNPTAA